MLHTLLALLSPAPIAHAGYDEDNMEVRCHQSASASVTEYYIHKHRGDAMPPLFSDSPRLTQSEWGDVKTEAAVSKSAFFDEIGPLLGGGSGWWGTLTNQNQSKLWDIVKDIC